MADTSSKPSSQASLDINNEDFWNDIPNEILEELYTQLQQQGPQEQSELFLEDFQSGSSAQWGRMSRQASLSQSQIASQLPIQPMPMNISSQALPQPQQNPTQQLTQSQLPLMQVPSELQRVTLKREPDVSPKPMEVVSTLPTTVIANNVCAGPVIAEPSRAQLAFEQMSRLDSLQDQQIEQIKQLQIQVLQQQKHPQLQELQELQQQMLVKIDQELKEMRELNNAFLLTTHDLYLYRVLKDNRHIRQAQIDLFKKELVAKLSSPASNPCLAALVVTNQSGGGQTVFKGKSVEEAYEVRLLRGAITPLVPQGPVKASLCSDDQNWKPSPSPLENDVQSLDAEGTAKFDNIKLNVSTRMSFVHLKFTLNALMGTPPQPVVVESANSSPLIIITNESQWCEAAGKLLQSEAFAAQNEVSWTQYCNALQRHFLKATRQDLAKPSRALSRADFQYIHAVRFFGGQPHVNQQQANGFWNMFGHSISTLRFKRHINSLWANGLIYGFINKNECNNLLQNEELGAFIIRFSENFPGLFAVAYVTDDETDKVKHYLVKGEDIGTNKALPDFLREKPQFQLLCQLDPATGKLNKMKKDVVLYPYYSKKKPLPKNGYITL